jgi:hypothetical protein
MIIVPVQLQTRWQSAQDNTHNESGPSQPAQQLGGLLLTVAYNSSSHDRGRYPPIYKEPMAWHYSLRWLSVTGLNGSSGSPATVHLCRSRSKQPVGAAHAVQCRSTFELRNMGAEQRHPPLLENLAMLLPSDSGWHCRHGCCSTALQQDRERSRQAARPAGRPAA